MLARAAWPVVRDLPTPLLGRRSGAARLAADTAATEYELVREAASAIRQIRADYAIAPGTVIDVVIDAAPGAREVFVEEAEGLGRLTRSEVRVGAAGGPAIPLATVAAAHRRPQSSVTVRPSSCPSPA